MFQILRYFAPVSHNIKLYFYLKMRKFAYFLFLSLLMFLVSCTPKWDPRKYKRVEIVDAGEIYSTFDINKHEKEKKILDKKRWLPDSVLRKVTAATSESRWPPAIQTPQLRHDNQKKMKQYKAYLITSFKNKHILYIPNTENKGANIAPELMSDRDFYMIIGKKGIEKKDEYMKGYENWTRPPRPKKPSAAVAATPSRATSKPDPKATSPDKKGKGVANLEENTPIKMEKSVKENPSAEAKNPKSKGEKTTVAKTESSKSKADKTTNKTAKTAKKKSDTKVKSANEDKEANFDKGKLTGATKKRINSEKGKKKKKAKRSKRKKTTKAGATSAPKTELLPPKTEKEGEKPKTGK